MRPEQTKEHFMTNRYTKLLPLVAALAVSGLANANTDSSIITTGKAQSIVVKYGDLNLGTSNGVKTLHTRLRKAAYQVCRPFDGRTLSGNAEYGACISDAVNRAVADVGNANLTRLHRYGRVGEFVAAN
jgi:UrcA family protein